MKNTSLAIIIPAFNETETIVDIIFRVQKYGDVIIFNPFILHGNKDFNSNLARIACSVRFQSRLKPIMQKNSDFFKLYNLN